jgi:hypothetical protein
MTLRELARALHITQESLDVKLAALGEVVESEEDLCATACLPPASF